MSTPVDLTTKRRVFVIHGRDIRLRDSMFAFLHALKLQPIEWMEAISWTRDPSAYVGQIIATAFQMAQAAVVILSGDDEARLRFGLRNDTDASIRLQPRPNVLFEAGIAFGYMPERTILVDFGATADFSDIAGRHTVRMSNSAESRHMLSERLKLAGCLVDTSGDYWLTAGDFTGHQSSTSTSQVPAAQRALDPSIAAILKVLTEKGHYMKLHDIATAAQQPLGKVRVLLKDLAEAKLVSYIDPPSGRMYHIADAGVRRLIEAGIV